MKTCSKCKKDKASDGFSPDKRASDGLMSQCRDCRNAYKNEYYHKVKNEPWFQQKLNANKKRKAAYDKEYSQRDYVKKNQAATRARNSKKRVQDAKEWAKNNPEKRRAISINYKSKRRAVTRKGMSGGDLAAWTKQQDKTCYWCKRRCDDAYHVDHMVPLSRGGAHESYNLAISCPPCNLKKSNKTPSQFIVELTNTVYPEML